MMTIRCSLLICFGISFYEKGRDDLTSDIRMILDTFPQQQNLRDEEKEY